MSVELIAIGGYEEIGKNISANPLEKADKISDSATKNRFLEGYSKKEFPWRKI